MLFMRVPHYAAVDAAVRRAPERGKKFVNAVLRRFGREVEEFASPADSPRRLLPRPGSGPLAFKFDVFPEDPIERLAVVHSHPLWLVQRWVARWGEPRTEEILRADNEVPPLTVRARGDRDALIARLAEEGVDARPGGRPESVVLEKPGKLSSLPSFREGLFVVQDEAQMAVAPRLAGAKRVIDLCAAPGGKSIHLADLGADVVACDASLDRARMIDTSVRRVAADGTRAPFRRVFDGALVDVPCSNTGVLGRRADARWRLKPKDVTAMVPLQRALLAAAKSLVVPGGRVVYSTCSVEPEENEQVAGPGETILPSSRSGGGFSSTIVAS
jgi:16S rRNA (cytosine967-C5)-methyltransferase